MILEHLKSRHVDIELHRPVIDEDNGVATFYLYNMSGQLCGYQQYRPGAPKQKSNNQTRGRYYTYRTKNLNSVWGIESLHYTPRMVFLCEGLFDACRFSELGYSAIAAFGNSLTPDIQNWLSCQFDRIIAVIDNDEDDAGKCLAKYGTEWHYAPGYHDVGECPEEVLKDFIKKVVDTHE